MLTGWIALDHSSLMGCIHLGCHWTHSSTASAYCTTRRSAFANVANAIEHRFLDPSFHHAKKKKRPLSHCVNPAIHVVCRRRVPLRRGKRKESRWLGFAPSLPLFDEVSLVEWRSSSRRCCGFLLEVGHGIMPISKLPAVWLICCSCH